MAEAALFSIASKVLSSAASPAFEKAYERARSIWGASDELKELKETITSIQAVLLDAEKKHTDSATVKNWVGRVRDVLYDAEDLFDIVATDDLLKQRMKGKKPVKSVRTFFSNLNPILSKDFISKKVEAIRKDLRRISDDMAALGFVRCESEKLSISGIRRGVETGSFVDMENTIGRDDEMKRVIDFVYNQAFAECTVSLISIVGIGGMGKSTLAQLVYNDAKISDGFLHRYWACISNIFDEKEVLGKINQSMTGQGKYQELSLDQLQSSVRKSIHKNGRFLLVLDDLWDEDIGRWSKLLSILSSDHAKGSKIIITTRNLSVAKAMRSDETLELGGLSKDESWTLFKRYAFTKDQENDPAWISAGKKIVNKCSNVPLAIKSIASLLRIKDTIGEWRSLENEQLSKIQLSDNPIMSTLRLSYDHLPSHLKNCFAYCSLYPKDSELVKKHLIYLWIAQGYIRPLEGETLEMAGNACFMELFRRSFFQEAKYENGEIMKCKMHDLVHDLAEDVAGEESCSITTEGKNRSHQNKIRHLFLDYDVDDNQLLLLDADRLRTFLCGRGSSRLQLDEKVTKFRFLRALSLASQRIIKDRSSIGEMKCLRYLNLSDNWFTHLPDSITKLVNLITLDVSQCGQLVKLPGDIGELVSLRHLINYGCFKLLGMPPTLGELTTLEHLSDFKVTKSGDIVSGEFCGLNALSRLKIRGTLKISFDRGVEWNRDEVLLESGQVPNTLEKLNIEYYPTMRMPAWWTTEASSFPKLERLYIGNSVCVKHLPPLQHLPCLKCLCLSELHMLEFIEDDEVVSTTPSFPSLCTLEMMEMRNLKGWSRPTTTSTHVSHDSGVWGVRMYVPMLRKNREGWSRPTNSIMFPCLSELRIEDCPLLTSLPINAPRLKSMKLSYVSAELVIPLVSSPCASGVEKIEIKECDQLSKFSGKGLTSLRSLKIINCRSLSKVRVARDTVEEFTIHDCPTWLFNKIDVDWASFANLRVLTHDKPGCYWLPKRLQQRILLGKLRNDYLPRIKHENVMSAAAIFKNACERQ